MKNRWLLLTVAGVILLALIGCGGIRPTTAAPRKELETLPKESTAQPDEVVTIEVHGRVVPVCEADISFRTSGTVAEWYVEEGDVVQAGTALGRLDSTLVELDLRQAKTALEQAQARLEQAQVKHTHQFTKAELALLVAESELEKARASFPDLVAAEVHLKQATQAEADASYEYQKAKDRPWEPQEALDAYARAWEKAKDGLKVAQAGYDALRRERYASSQEIQTLEYEVQKAEAEIDYLQTGIDPTLGVEVKKAQLALEGAQAALDAATLVAPFDGTVVALHVQPFETTTPASPAATLADLSTLQIETVDLDEWGAAQIRVDNEATVVIPALNDYEVTGRVAAIAPRGEEQPAGDVTFRALITLEEQNPDLRWGMTANIILPIRR